MNKNKILKIILLELILIIIVLILLYNLNYTRDVIIINVESKEIRETTFGFQTTNFIRGFFNTKNSGDLSLYYEIREANNNEVVIAKNINNIGDGVIVISDINFPETNSTWKAILKLKNNLVLDEECYQIRFFMDDKWRRINQDDC